ncbi:MAG: hypothetical protein GEU94_09095 [Micromonosporaceae bacterium]|nr:hypothetical protein [Micromonosporaceae bacterium]
MTQVDKPRREQRPSLLTTGAEPTATSLFVNGHAPNRRWLVILLASLGGFLLTVIWSAEFVDRTIGDSVANTALGHDAKATPIAGILAGVAFAFVSGIAGTFTACNIAAFSAVAPLVGKTQSRLARLGQTLKPLGWLSVGIIAVSATYGVIVALVGTNMPQFDETMNRSGFSPRLIQAMVLFGVVGVIMIYLGLAALRLAPDPMAGIAKRFPNAPLVFLGGLIGGFLIGRPFELFRIMFRDAAESGNVLYGAGAFALQSLGNIVILAVLFLILAYTAGARLGSWLTEKPSRFSVMVASGFLVAGVFTVLYWDVRILARRELIWYPIAPWIE